MSSVSSPTAPATTHAAASGSTTTETGEALATDESVAASLQNAPDEYSTSSSSTLFSQALGAGMPKKARHVVGENDTLYSIGRRYGVKVSSLQAYNGLKNDRIAPGQQISIPGHLSIEVRPKQTLYAIAQDYGTTVDQLKLKNELTSENLALGQTLIVPGTLKSKQGPKKPGKHLVQDNETLWGLAKKYDTTPADFMRVNGMKNKTIYPGQYLQIPNQPYYSDGWVERPEPTPAAGLSAAEQASAIAELESAIADGPHDVLSSALSRLLTEHPEAAAHLAEKVETYWGSDTVPAHEALRSDLAVAEEMHFDEVAGAAEAYTRRFGKSDPRSMPFYWFATKVIKTAIPGGKYIPGVDVAVKESFWSTTLQTESDLQDMAEALGEAPFGFEGVLEDHVDHMRDILENTVSQLDVSDSEAATIKTALAEALAESYLQNVYGKVPNVSGNVKPSQVATRYILGLLTSL